MSRAASQPGGERTYVYEHVEEGEPLRGAMRWYHDHSHGRTNRNSWMGLLGPVHRRGPAREARCGCRAGERELLLVLTTRTLDDNNQLVDPFTARGRPRRRRRRLGLADARQRRLAARTASSSRRPTGCASSTPRASARTTSASPKGPQIVQIGNESGLFPAPAERERVLMGPAERCDLVVDFSGFAGKRVVLGSTPQEATRAARLASLAPGHGARRGAHASSACAPKLQAPQAAAARCPTKLRELPAWTRQLPTAARPHVRLRPGASTRLAATDLDDQRRALRPRARRRAARARVDRDVAAGQLSASRATTSTCTRSTGRSSRATAACPRADEDVLKETFRLDPGETLAVGAKFTDHLGRFLIHCHMLSHEDHAMMTTFEIVEPGSGDRGRAIPAAQRLTPTKLCRLSS